MDKVSESIFSTLKRVKAAIVQDDSAEDESEKQEEVEADLGSTQSNPERNKVKGKRHSREHKGEEAPDEEEYHATESHTLPKSKKNSPNYVSGTKGKDNTLLALAQSKNPDHCPNSATGRRVKSMKFASSMTSVYRKINKDKNAHNDRHYLVAVTEQIKTDAHPPREGKGKKH